jgi:hypothetical protein
MVFKMCKRVVLIQILSAIFLLISLASCTNKDVPTNPSEKGIGSFYGVSNEPQNCDGYLYTTLTRYMKNDGGYSDAFQDQAYFYDANGNHIIVESLFLNNVLFNQSRLIDTIHVPFDGVQNHIWDVHGSPYLPPYSDTILSVNAININSPRSWIDTVYKHNGLTIQYSQIFGIDSIMVLVETDNLMAHNFDTTVVVDNDVKNYLITSNTGNIYLPPSFFGNFPNNSMIEVSIMAARTKTKQVENKNFLIACFSRCVAFYVIKN